MKDVMLLSSYMNSIFPRLAPTHAIPPTTPQVCLARERSALMSIWVIGIGCRRGASVEQIHAAVFEALGTRPLASVRALASIDLKKDETALLEFAARHGLRRPGHAIPVRC